MSFAENGYKGTNLREFHSLVMQMVDFTIHDRRIILSRKLLLTEQFHDDRVRALATEHFMNGTKAMFRQILANMMEKGIIRKDDPDMLSFVFTSYHITDSLPRPRA